MASSISTPTTTCFCLSSTSSTTWKQQSVWTISNSAISLTKVSNFELSNRVLEKGISQFSQWNGLKTLGISNSGVVVKIGRKGKCKGKGVFASLFGVGAPEVLVIGVVALLVFGPKGLAEVARNLGKTLRAFQPTIRELQDVSREFKSTLEREIGLDEIQTSNQNAYRPNITKTTSSSPPNSSSEDSQVEIDPTPSKSYSSEDYLKITEEQLRAASAAQQNTESTSTTAESPPEVKRESQDTPQEVASTMPSPGKTENEK